MKVIEQKAHLVVLQSRVTWIQGHTRRRLSYKRDTNWGLEREKELVNSNLAHARHMQMLDMIFITKAKITTIDSIINSPDLVVKLFSSN